MKRMVTSLLAGMMMVLSACGGGEGAAVTAPNGSTVPAEQSEQQVLSVGRYVETDISPEEASSGSYGGSKLWAREDGSLDLLTVTVQEVAEEEYVDTVNWFHSADRGESWERRDLPDWENIGNWLIGKEGDVYGIFYNRTDNVLVEHHQDAQGESEQREISLEEGIPITELEGDFCGETYYLVTHVHQGNVTIYALSLESGEVAWKQKLGSSDVNGWSNLGEKIYCNNGVVLDAATGKQVDQVDLSTFHARYLSKTQVTNEGTYYYVDDAGDFCRGIFGQEQKEIILESEEYRYGADLSAMMSLLPSSFAVLPDGTIFLNAANEADAVNLYRYDFDTQAKSVGDTLNIWSLEESATIQQAVHAFAQEHPELRINYQTPDLENGAQTREDILSALNTKILAGQGPDVLILDGIGYQRYMERGVLADLTELFEEREFVGETVSSLRNSSGKCYVLPARFTLPVIFRRDGTLPTAVEELTRAVDEGGIEAQQSQFEHGEDGKLSLVPNTQAETEKPLFHLDFSAVWEMFWARSAPALFEGDSLNEEELSRLLEALKSVSDHFDYFRDNSDGLGVAMVGTGNPYSYGNRNVLSEGSAMEWEMGETQTGVIVLDSIDELVSTVEASEKFRSGEGRFSVAAFPGLSEGAYTPKLLMAVSNASARQEVAKEFVATVLSMDVQQYTYGDGLPVLAGAMERQLNHFAEYTQPCGWNIQELETVFAKLDAPVVTAQAEQEVIYEAAKEYCRGDYTLEETLQSIRESLALRLAEQ